MSDPELVVLGGQKTWSNMFRTNVANVEGPVQLRSKSFTPISRSSLRKFDRRPPSFRLSESNSRSFRPSSSAVYGKLPEGDETFSDLVIGISTVASLMNL